MIDIIYLLALILIPAFIPALFVVGAFGEGKQILKRCEFALTLHVDRGLSHQGLLWLCISSPILYFIATGLIAWKGYSPSLTGEGLNTFIKISSIPLTLLSISLPLSVLVASLHSSKQTAEQIKIIRKKNNIESFYAHRRELFSYFAEIGENNYINCIHAKNKVHPRLHKNFFSGSPEEGHPVVNESSFVRVEELLSSAQLFLDIVIRNADPERVFSLYAANLCPHIYELSRVLGLPEIYITLADKSAYCSTVIDEEEVRHLTLGYSTDEAVAAYRYIKDYYKNLCDFAGRESLLVIHPEFEYLDTGGKFRTAHEYLVIESLLGHPPLD